MITDLRSILIENGITTDSCKLNFQLYHKDIGEEVFSRISEWKSFDEENVHRILFIQFDTTKKHPLVFRLYADCGDKQVYLTTCMGTKFLSIETVYCDSASLIQHDSLNKACFGSMPAGCHM